MIPLHLPSLIFFLILALMFANSLLYQVSFIFNLYFILFLLLSAFSFVINHSFLIENYWSNLENRKEVFKSYANEKGFDSLVAENWYSLLPSDFLKHKVTMIIILNNNNKWIKRAFINDIKKDGKTIYHLYQGNLGKALQHVFPEIGLNKDNLRPLSRELLLLLLFYICCFYCYCLLLMIVKKRVCVERCTTAKRLLFFFCSK